MLQKLKNPLIRLKTMSLGMDFSKGNRLQLINIVQEIKIKLYTVTYFVV